MPQRIIVGSDNSYRVVDVGPRGIRGPRGLPGTGGSGAGRKGFELIQEHTTETIDGHEYSVFSFGASNSEEYVLPYVDGMADRVLLRCTSTEEYTDGLQFTVSLIPSGQNKDVYVFTEAFGPLQITGFWEHMDNPNTMDMVFSPLPGALFGGTGTLWIPQMKVTASPRVGASFITAHDESGDGDSDPDVSVTVVGPDTNATSFTADVDGKSYVLIEDMSYLASRPYRIELLNASSVTKIRFHVIPGNYEFVSDDLVPLRVGTSLVFMARVKATAPYVYAVALDSIIQDLSAYSKFRMPTAASSSELNLSGDTVIDVGIMDNFRQFVDGCVSDITFSGLEPGEHTTVEMTVMNGGYGNPPGTLTVSILGAPVGRINDIPDNLRRVFMVHVKRDLEGVYSAIYTTGHTVDAGNPDY